MATLGDVWTDFYRTRGRTELSDAEVLRMFNQASRKLDMMCGRHHMKSRSLVSLNTEGQYRVSLPEDLRAPSSLWFRSSEGAMYKMTRVEADRIYLTYPNLDVDTVSERDLGTPGHWDLAPVKFDNGVGYYNDCGLTFAEADFYYNADDLIRMILIAPAVSSDAVGGEIIIWGTHWTPKLRGTGDSNFWVEQYPDALLFAAMWRYDTLRRPSTSSKDWLAEAEMQLRGYRIALAASVSRDVPMQMDP